MLWKFLMSRLNCQEQNLLPVLTVTHPHSQSWKKCCLSTLEEFGVCDIVEGETIYIFKGPGIGIWHFLKLSIQATYQRDPEDSLRFWHNSICYTCITQQQFQIPQRIHAQYYLEITRAILRYWILSLANEHMLFTCLDILSYSILMLFLSLLPIWFSFMHLQSYSEKELNILEKQSRKQTKSDDSLKKRSKVIQGGKSLLKFQTF